MAADKREPLSVSMPPKAERSAAAALAPHLLDSPGAPSPTLPRDSSLLFDEDDDVVAGGADGDEEDDYDDEAMAELEAEMLAMTE